ncbi:hypothetical protein VaNZ11_005190, partial [Volvox africanus]
GGGGGGGLMVGPGSPLAARRNLASPVGHNGGGGGGGGCTSDLGFHDPVWGPSQNLGSGHLQLEQQQQQHSLQRLPCGLAVGGENWSKQCTLGGGPHLPNAIPDGAVYGVPGAVDVSFGGLVGGATAASQGRGPLPAPAPVPAGGSSSVVSAGVSAILNDTSAGGLLMGLEAMVAGVSGQRSLGPEQLSEEELALLGIQGADRDLLLDPTTDNSLDPLLDLLLAGGDALMGAGAAVTGVSRQSSQHQHQHQQQYSMPHNPPNDALLATQQQQLYSQIDVHRFSSTLAHQQPHPPAPVQPLIAAAGFGPARRLSDAMHATDGRLSNIGGSGVASVSSLPRTSASGLSLTASGYGGGGGGITAGALGGPGCIGSGSHSAPLRQHRLSSVSGLSTGMGQRPSRFAGGVDLSLTAAQPLEFSHHRGIVGGGADGSLGNGGGGGNGGVLMGAVSCDDRYSAMCGASDAPNGASHSGPMPQLTSLYGAGDAAASAAAIAGGLGRRRDFPPGALSGPHQQPSSQLPYLHPHQHVLNAFEGRHSAPGQFCIPGWDETRGLAHSGGSGNASHCFDPTTLAGRMLLSSTGPMQTATAPDLTRLLGIGTPTTAAAANAVATSASMKRLAAVLGSEWPLNTRQEIGDGGAADCNGRDIARRMAAAHARSNSASGLLDRDGLAGGGAAPPAAAACSRPSTGSGYNGAASSLSLLNRRDPQLTGRDQLTLTTLNTPSHNNNSGSGAAGPAAVAAALGAQGLRMPPQSPLMPSLSDPPPGRGVAGHVSPPPDTIVSLQGLRLRGEDDRIAAGEQLPPGSNLLFLRSRAAAVATAATAAAGDGGGDGSIGGSGGGNEQLTSVLQELQSLKRQQQQQIQEQAHQIQRQQMQIARLGLLGRIAAYDDPYSLGDTPPTTAEVATGTANQQQQQQQQQQTSPSNFQGHGAVAAATAPRQQMQHPYDDDNSIGGGGGGGGDGGRSSGLLEAVDGQLSDIDTFMELNMDLLWRNNSGFGSFMNEMRASSLAGGSGGSFTLGGAGAGAGTGGGAGGCNDMEVMRQNLRKDLRQNSAEQWEEMLKQLAGSGGA